MVIKTENGSKKKQLKHMGQYYNAWEFWPVVACARRIGETEYIEIRSKK